MKENSPATLGLQKHWSPSELRNLAAADREAILAAQAEALYRNDSALVDDVLLISDVAKSAALVHRQGDARSDETGTEADLKSIADAENRSCTTGG